LIYRIFFTAEKFLKENDLGHAFINSFNSISCIIDRVDGIWDCLEVCAALKDAISKKVGLSMTIGLGRTYSGLTELRFSAKEAAAALRYRYVLGYNTIIPIDFAEPGNQITYKYPDAKEQMLIHTAVAGEYKYAVKLLTEILTSLDEAASLPTMLLPKIIMNIAISISRYADEIGMGAESRFREFFDFSAILNIREIPQAQKFMEDSLKAFCDFVAVRMSEHSQKLVMATRSRIDESFFEDLSLENIALEHSTTAEFLGKVFNERVGLSFKDYLMSRRVAKAKEIMENEPGISEEEVAARVGFFDVRVFRSVFRKAGTTTLGRP
jgi:two-component system response regulator YesN